MDMKRIEMMQMTSGYWISKSLYCAAKAGVADLLKDGPLSVEELAEKSGTKANRLFRILRCLAAVGVFEETSDRVFALTPKAEYLRSDNPATMKDAVLMLNGDLFEVWADLDHALYTDEAAVDKRFGSDFFVKLMQDQDKAAIFDRAMEQIHLGENSVLLELYDFAKHDTIMDVGGGSGSVLDAITRKHSNVKGVVFELPPVAERTQKLLQDIGVTDRISTVGGSFFEKITGEADCIFMRHIIHDWDDARSTTILNNCAEVLKSGQTLLIAEKVVPAGNEFNVVKLLDINMMAIGGKERTEVEYKELLDACGFDLVTIHSSGPGPVDIVEAKKR